MDDDLKEALDIIQDLRAVIQLVYYEPKKQLDVNEVDESMNQARAVLAKHNYPDDMMDVENPPQ